jgi:hypothetical protein
MINPTPKSLINNHDIFGEEILPFMIEVILPNGKDSFLKSIETLQRIGVINYRKKELYQICFILHKRNRYYIAHHNVLQLLDGEENVISDEDCSIQLSISLLLEQWGMIKIVDKHKYETLTNQRLMFKVVSHKDKLSWTMIPKYNINKRKNIL